jgi:hypothetical protein
MVLRRPVKYNPDKRDFVLTESALSSFDKATTQSTKTQMSSEDLFEKQSDISRTDSNISQGNRVS